jgi:hypothetical protein
MEASRLIEQCEKNAGVLKAGLVPRLVCDSKHAFALND